MNTFSFTKKIFVRSITSIFYFGFKYFWLLFKTMRSRPLLISQLKALAMLVVPVLIVIRFPIHIVVCIYCIAAMIYGVYSAYSEEIEYEKEFFEIRSMARFDERQDLWREYNSSKSDASENTQNEQAENTINQTGQSGFCPFTDNMTIDEAKARYHQLLKMGHPDNGGDEEFSKFLNEEYKTFCENHS